MNSPSLIITDRTLANTVDLLSLKGWLLRDWKPTVAEPKGGGVFRNSPLVDGRRLAYRKLDNITDTFNLVGSADNQDLMIASIQKLQRVLEKATSYWTSSWQNEPVWIKAKATNETGARYAVIVDYRLTGFGGPFQQPFFGGCQSATEAILVIEHTLWQETEPGLDGQCVELGNPFESAEIDTYTSGLFYPAQSSDDATFQNISPTLTVGGDLSNANIGVGFQTVLTGECSCGIAFANVTVPFMAKVAKATLTLSAGIISMGELTLRINGQNPGYGAGTTFSTQTDFFSRHRSAEFQIVQLADGAYPGAIDVTQIVQRIVDPTSDMIYQWASGDRMVFFISIQPGQNAGREFRAFDHGDAGEYPKLYIEWADTGVELGAVATCNQEVVVANKQNRAVITHVFYKDDDGGWSANLLAGSPPYSLLPAAPGVGDRIYFISDTTHSDAGPFDNVIFDLLTAQTGITAGAWKYPNGAAWHPFEQDAMAELCGDAELFAQEGTVGVVFTPQANWDNTETVNGITGWAICFEVTAVDGGGATAPVQHTRHVYTAILPYVDIEADQVPGDLPALARILFDGTGCYYSPNTVVMGLRTLSRGEDFAAYLNASDIQNPPGVTFTMKVGIAGLVDDPVSPTGKYLGLSGLTTNDLWTEVCSWLITGDLAKQYIGIYHAYLRTHSDERNRFRLRATFGEEYNTSYSDSNSEIYTVANLIIAMDLGQLVVQPSMTIRPNDKVDYVKIALETASPNDASYVQSYVYDIVLIPADEWSGNFGTPVVSVGTQNALLSKGRGLDVDAITNPRQYRASMSNIVIADPVYADSERTIVAEWSRIASSEPILQSNVAQRMWFLQYAHQTDLVTYFQSCGKVCAQRSARYILARGSA